MKNCIIAVTLTLLSLSGCNFSKQLGRPEVVSLADSKPVDQCKKRPTTPLTYKDQDGNSWTRHILTEIESDQRTLLLVIDEPSSDQFLPKLVLRKSFTARESAKMTEAQIAAATLLSPQMLTLTPTNNPIWPIDRAWTAQDETDYGAWIHNAAAVDLLVGGGVDVDCADYAIALRWIYAHDHHLPAGNSLALTGQLFGSWQSTTTWDALPADADWKKDLRFKAALRHVLNLTYTHSLFKDLYPVTITPEYITPGTIFITLASGSGHTRTITAVGHDPICVQSSDCIEILWGNEPAAELGTLSELVPSRVGSTEGGFMRFRWPERTVAGWQLHPALTMPGFSLEQYSWDDNNYLDNFSTRLSLWAAPMDRYMVSGDHAYELLATRLMVTEIGYFQCSLAPCSSHDPEYADWSTPVRDQAIANAIHSFQVAGAQVDLSSDVVQNYQAQFLGHPFNGSPYSFLDVLNGSINKAFISDPSVDFLTRWGVANPSVELKMTVLIDTISLNWHLRTQMVANAQNLCFPNGGNTAVCDPCDGKVKKLATDRVDLAFRNARAIFVSLYNSSSPQTQQDFTAKLKDGFMDSPACSARGQDCTLYDYVLGTTDHWAVMSSRPEDPLLKRYGF